MNLQNMLLYYSFLQIKGFSKKKEQAYWSKGIDSLGKLADNDDLQQSLFKTINITTESIQALEDKDIHFFASRLDRKYFYRIAYSFPDDVMFLDIETTGLSRVYHYITLVGWMMNGRFDFWIQGTDPDKFLQTFNSAKMIVTYNGTLFDCKFLNHVFQTDIFTEKPHLDLMYFCRRFGLKKGQKHFEKEVGFLRPNNIEDADGKEAIALWYSFLFGDDEALKKLITYNFYDILGMTYILDSVFFNYVYGKEFPQKGNPKKFFSKEIGLSQKNTNLKKKTLISIRNYVKRNISNFSMSNLQKANSYSILGIDLAGKVSSRTGVCLLKGKDAQTWVAHTNEEICKLVKNTCPDLISIDAPLSLPKGRNSVYDNDPTFKQAGIIRYCERVLKGRNVNSYPALIKSMQELTKRGIQLAELFRSQGYPVIECFPGAAQDVVQLPRKRTDESLLKRGLSELGIDGEYKIKNVCHDELDAITASLVGQFFLSNYYEPLGIPEENDMIIPQKAYRLPKHDIVIGLAGPIATGKTVVGKYISKQKYHYIRYSQVIENDISKDNSFVHRDDLRKEGWKLYNGHKQYELNKKLAKFVSDYPNIVIDGMRHNEDYTFWKEQGYLNFFLIYIDSQYDVCQKRFDFRAEDSVSYDIAISHPIESHVKDLKEKADFIVSNNGTLKELFNKIDNIMQQVNT